mmetsp:Transcript_7107/g.11195  ORF Transcript_7107/g.11195 Transcript_7107/m.11195 type:complete len:167 (-) Transcript_7107:1276-1776(-)
MKERIHQLNLTFQLLARDGSGQANEVDKDVVKTKMQGLKKFVKELEGDAFTQTEGQVAEPEESEAPKATHAKPAVLVTAAVDRSTREEASASLDEKYSIGIGSHVASYEPEYVEVQNSTTQPQYFPEEDISSAAATVSKQQLPPPAIPSRPGRRTVTVRTGSIFDI